MRAFTGPSSKDLALFKDREGVKKKVSDFPRLYASAVRLAWSAGPWRLILSSVLQLINATGAAAMLFAARSALDVLVSSIGSGRTLWSMSGRLLPIVAITVGQQLVQAVFSRQQFHMMARVTYEAQKRVLDVAASADLIAFETPDFSNRLRRAELGGQAVAGAVYGLVGVLGSFLTVAAVSFALVRINPILLPLLVLASLPSLVTSIWTGKRSFGLFVQQVEGGRRLAYLQALLTGRAEAKEVRAFNLARPLRIRWDDLYEKQMDEQIDMNRKNQLRNMAGQGTGTLMTGAIFVVAAGWLLKGTVGVGGVGAALLGAQQIRGRLARLTFSIGSLYSSGLSLSDLDILETMHSAGQARKPTGEVPGPFNHLAAKGITFFYPGTETPALADVSVDIKAGEVVALVGENGSGKTTLAKLLASLYQPSEGTILWDGIDASTVAGEKLREHIAVIFQDYVKWEFSLRENITMGRSEAASDDESVGAAARAAGLEELARQLPDGWETILSKTLAEGTDLSIGQWQKVALARAFFRNAEFVILDEPTASLDARAEKELFDRIRNLYGGRSVLLISHRFSTVRSADRIYVLDKGRLVEEGTHEELMGACGLYEELFKIQAAPYTQTS